jgi:membrane protein implicated in regulation of membrane protease activity
MTHGQDISVGLGATFVVTLAGAEDFGMKLMSSVVVAIVTTVVVYFVRRALERRDKANASKSL